MIVLCILTVGSLRVYNDSVVYFDRRKSLVVK